MQQEDGEVHGHTQLQHRGQRLGDVGDLPQKPVAAEVVENGEGDAGHEQQRRGGLLDTEEQQNQAASHGAEDVQRHLPVDEVFGVGEDGRHAADKAVFVQQGFDLVDGLHGGGAGAGVGKFHQQQLGVVFAVEELLHILRQHLSGHRLAQQVAAAHDGVHPRHFGQLGFQLCQLRRRHVFHRDHRRTGGVEVAVQVGLAHHGVQLRGQIGENVVVDIGARSPQNRGDQQQHRQHKHQLAAAHHPACKSFQAIISLEVTDSQFWLMHHSIHMK